MMRGRFATLAMVALGSGSAFGQSINVSFGHTSGGPSSSYAAAGAAGVWNSITGVSGSSFNLVDTNGASTLVTVGQSPTTTVITSADPSVSGDDAALLNSGLVTTGAETCLSFMGFKAGTYEVLVYAWLPNQPTVKSRTRQDEAASTIDVGGAWTGAHVAGVTYARYVVTVDTSGNLPAHSGLVPGAPASALNAVQIRPLGGAQADAGTPPAFDAGSGAPPDLGSITHPGDAGATGGADLGGGGAPPPGQADGGVTPPSQKGGCSYGGGDVRSLALVVFLLLPLAFVRRRRSK
jgi:hypothetical protein